MKDNAASQRVEAMTRNPRMRAVEELKFTLGESDAVNAVSGREHARQAFFAVNLSTFPVFMVGHAAAVPLRSKPLDLA